MNKQAEINEKTGRLTRMLAEIDAGGVLINAQHNFAWLTAGASNGVDASRDSGVASIMVRRDGKKFLLASKIEMPRMLAEEVAAEEFEPVGFAWEDDKASASFITDLASSLLNDDSPLLAVDLQFNAQVRVVENLITNCRAQLTSDEIERYRALGADAGEIVGAFAANMQPGQSEREIAWQVRAKLAERDIDSVVTLVAADERIARFRHPVPTDKRWTQTLMIVVCARRGGLIASLTRIVCAGNIPAELRRRTDSVARVHAAMLDATRAGAKASEIFKLTAELYAKEGFAGEEHLHHQGGACGYRTRDWTAHPKSAEVVKPNQAFAWNPSITGTKSEETFIVTDDGAEIISASPQFPASINIINGREYRTPGILSL